MKVLDTIAAISTPRGKGGVAMIRITGERAFEFADKVFFPKNRIPLKDAKANKAIYGFIKQRDSLGTLETIDDGIAIIYRAPNSFTGEDTVEICCHGGVLVTESVLVACLAAGCRQAEAGEFTRRAFISGKLSLSQAEGLGSLLEAKTHSQMALSRGSMEGRLSKALRSFYEEIRELLSGVYAKIDFPEEDLSSLSDSELLCRVESIEKRLLELERTYKTGRAISEGIRTVICGKTNAGKSSLYNLIVGRNAAIVTDIAGTTRDILEQTASLGSVTLLLCDTAGLRKTDDTVENIGIDRTHDAIKSAELIFAVFDASTPLSNEDRDLIRELCENETRSVIAILNKCDSEICQNTIDEIKSSFAKYVMMSAKTGEGFDTLTKEVENLYRCGEIDLLSDAIVVSARQHASLLRALEAVNSACEALRAGITVDLCGTDLEAAMSALAEIDGRDVNDDIISEIFSHFCVGK